VHKVFAATAIAAVTTALTACSATTSRDTAAAAPLTYEPPTPVMRAPLAPPEGYASASASTSSLSPGNADEAARLGWHASPRWAAIKGKGIPVDSADPQVKFKAAKTKAAKIGVENLSDDDVKGLTPAQFRDLRGY
jgi:hypothetical protein